MDTSTTPRKYTTWPRVKDPTPRTGLRMQGCGFEGLDFGVQGLGCRGFRVWGLP